VKKEIAKQKLAEIGQEHLLDYWDGLAPDERKGLYEQIERLDSALYRKQKQLFEGKDESKAEEIYPFDDCISVDEVGDPTLGRELIQKGTVGCLIVAGGQGTRLGFDGPKGMFPVTNVKEKSLFQLLAEKVRYAGICVEKPLQLAVMTSSLNHEQTTTFFEENNYFGLLPEQVDFFMQGTLPLLNEEGDLFLERPYKIAEGPDGNGSSLSHFMQSGIWQKWWEMGIRTVSFLLGDNALADPFDSALVQFHHENNSEITVKCVERRNPHEKVGILVRTAETIQVVEYSELPDEEKIAINDAGLLKHRFANISTFCFSMDFIRSLDKEGINWHLAHKASAYVDEGGQTVKTDDLHAWKYEYFIFDVLPLSNKISALLYPRQKCFAPLKNRVGQDSVAIVKALLQQFDVETYEKISGVESPDRCFELSPAFYYPTEEIRYRWKDRELSDRTYVEG